MPRCHSWCNGLCPSCYRQTRRNGSGRFPSGTRTLPREDLRRDRGGPRTRSISPTWTDPRTYVTSSSYGMSPPRTVLQPVQTSPPGAYLWTPASGPGYYRWPGYMAPRPTSAYIQNATLCNEFYGGGPQPIYDYPGWSYPSWDMQSNATRRTWDMQSDVTRPRRSSDLSGHPITESPTGSTIGYGASTDINSPSPTNNDSRDGSSSGTVNVRLPTRYMDMAMFRYFDDLFQERFDRGDGRRSGRRSGRERAGW